jgi:hypothetical protein
MAQENPPNVNVFNGINYNSDFFIEDNNGLTFEEASSLFLRYPNAQGTENLLTTNISGVLTSSSTANFTGVVNSSNILNINDATLANQEKICLNLESQGVPLSRLRFSLNPSAGFLNPIVRSGDIAMCYGTLIPNATALAIAPVGATSCGLRMSREGVGIGSGGTGVEQNNRIIITPSAFSLVANGTQNQVDIANNVVLNNAIGTNRQLTTSYLNLNDITLNTLSGRIYGSGTNIAMDNNIIMSNASAGNRNISATFYNYTLQSDNSTIAGSFMTNGGVLFFDNNFNGGQFGFTVNDGSGIQRSPLIMSAGAFTIASTNPPTSSASIPTFSNDTTLATTAWVNNTVSFGRTQTISITTSTTTVIPAGVMGIGIRMIAKGGIPGLNADTGTNYSSGGTGGGASSVVSNGIIPIIGGSSLISVFDAVGISLSYRSLVICSCNNGNNGGNASGTSGGTGALIQNLGTIGSSFGSFTIYPGQAGVNGIGNQSFGSITGVPTIASTSNASSTGFQGFQDGLRGCGQRYRFVSGNGYITSTTAPVDGIIYLTYFYT